MKISKIPNSDLHKSPPITEKINQKKFQKSIIFEQS